MMNRGVNTGVLRNIHLATCNGRGHGYGEIRDAALVWENGVIVWLGPECELPDIFVNQPWQDGAGGWLMPGFIDCHTHIVFGGSRANEFEARLNGVDYTTIALNGGGIAATVRATRALSEDELLAASLPRVDALLAEGVTTLEIKSGYGLNLDNERNMLRVARRIGELRSVNVRTTFLGAHAVPPEFTTQGGNATDHYLDVVLTMLPVLNEEGLIDAVDAFCETIAFSPAQVDRLFAAAQKLGLPVKLHAEQLSDQHGAALVAKYRGLSADHLEWLEESGIAAMKASGTVAVLLPGAFYYLRETRLPPVDALRAAGVPIAVSTDCNPGTSPLTSLLAAANMACVLFRLTPQEALTGITQHAAAALGLHDRGMLAVGQRADMALWPIASPVDLVYTLGTYRPAACWVGGTRRES